MAEKVNVRAQLEKLGKEMPEIMNSFNQLTAETLKGGALSVKTKTLIAVALAVGLRCEFCTRLHVPEAVKAGASRAEILEAAGVSTMMTGGPGLAFAGEVLLEELDKLGIK